MILKCKPLEITRKKFSDFEFSETSPNKELYLVGYEIDNEGNKKNVKILSSEITQKSKKKIKHITNISKDGGDGYEIKEGENHKQIIFSLADCVDFLQIGVLGQSQSIDTVLYESDCDDYGVDLGFDVSGLSEEELIGRNSLLLLRNACPKDKEVTFFFNGSEIATIMHGETLLINILHTFDSEIISSLSKYEGTFDDVLIEDANND